MEKSRTAHRAKPIGSQPKFLARHTEVRTERENKLSLQISSLLDRLREANGEIPIDTEAIRAIESEIVSLLDGYLRESLLPVMAKMFGPQVYRKDRDSSACFTAMMNELFIKILNRRTESGSEGSKSEGSNSEEFKKTELTKFDDARHLRNWCSRVIRNQMLNHLRTKQQRRESFQAIAPLYEAQKAHFEGGLGRGKGIDTYDRALLIIDSWENSKDPVLQRYAAILGLRYILGASWEEVCEALNIRRTKAFDECKLAKEALHNQL